MRRSRCLLLYCAVENEIYIPEELKEKFYNMIKSKKINKQRTSYQYIIENVIRSNSFHLLTAQKGQGKSYFTMMLGYAIARKGKMFRNWKVNTPTKVLYIIDEEVDSLELKKRQSIMERIYREKDNSRSITFESVSNMDLATDADRKNVEEMIINANCYSLPRNETVGVLILDHLTKLAPLVTNQYKWNKFRPWLNKLQKKYNLAVVLVHHENSKNKSYGSSYIENDASVRIQIEKEPVETHLVQNITVPHNRESRIQLLPKKVRLSIDKPKVVFDADSNEIKKWKLLTEQERISIFVDMKQKKHTMQEIADFFDISKPTLEAFTGKNKLTKDSWKKHVPDKSSQ